MTAATVYLVETPSETLVVFGGPLKRADTLGHVWMTSPDGRPTFQVERRHIRVSSKEEVARMLADEAKRRASRRN